MGAVGRPRKTGRRAAMNTILYLLRAGCPWRYLPRDGFAPRSTDSNMFRKSHREGVSEGIWVDVARADGPGGHPLGGGSR